MSELQNIIENLKSKDEVDAVFLTGSHGANTKPYSDIDLIIILKENTKSLQSIFAWIDGIFADIYFFDMENIERIMSADWLTSSTNESKHTMNASLYSWVKKGTIQFDKSGSLTNLKNLKKEIKVAENEKLIEWKNINYNFEANTRYFESGDPLYYEALEIRLLYSIPQLISGYLKFHGVVWQGEKFAISYLKENNRAFYDEFVAYSKSSTLEEKFNHYKNLVKATLNPEFPLWDKAKIYPKSNNDPMKLDEVELVNYWTSLIA